MFRRADSMRGRDARSRRWTRLRIRTCRTKSNSSGSKISHDAPGRRATMLVRSSLLRWMQVAAAYAAPVSSKHAIVVAHVTVIDGTDSTSRADQTVVIRGNHIAAVGASRTSNVPAGARVVDGRGKFLIPGLWDMHVHTSMVGGRQ